jgi:hypothetical protein
MGNHRSHFVECALFEKIATTNDYLVSYGLSSLVFKEEVLHKQNYLGTLTKINKNKRKIKLSR